MKTQSAPWDINDLIQFFTENKAVGNTLALNGYLYISDLQKCITALLTTVKERNGNSTFEPYYKLLCEIRNRMIKN